MSSGDRHFWSDLAVAGDSLRRRGGELGGCTSDPSVFLGWRPLLEAYSAFYVPDINLGALSHIYSFKSYKEGR